MNRWTAHVVVVVVVVVVVASVARPLTDVTVQPVQIHWERSVQICGSRLTDLMVSVCKTKFYGPETNTDHVPTIRRRKRKIIEECCKVPCTYGHIYENYCDRRVYDTETEYVPPERWPNTRRIDDAVSTASSVTSTVASSTPTNAVVPTTSWFERFLNKLKFW